MPNRTRAKTRNARKTIEARNRLDGLVYSVEKTFGENKDKLDAARGSRNRNGDYRIENRSRAAKMQKR